MGTRGLFGMRKNGQDKAVYNHFDSYPEYLGKEFLSFIKMNGPEKLSQFFDNIKLIDADVNPTQEQKEYCKQMGWFDNTVSNQSDNDWYCLLRGTQDLDAWQKCIDKNQEIYLDNYIDFIKNSLFCEYAYIFDLDTNVLEFYVGFQKLPQVGNRYGIMPENRYYPCKLVLTIPLDEINITKSIEDMQKVDRI